MQDLQELLNEVTTEKSLGLIALETRPLSKMRQQSVFLIQAIKKHFPRVAESAEEPMLREVIVETLVEAAREGVDLQEWTEVLLQIQILYHVVWANPHSQIQAFWQLRRVLLDPKQVELRELRALVKEHLRVKRETVETLLDKQRRRVIQTNENPVEIAYTDVCVVVRHYLTSAKWAERVTALALAIGARMVELLSDRVSSFVRVGASSSVTDSYIKQIGVAKVKRLRDDESDSDGEEAPVIPDVVIKPILCGLTVDQILGAIDSIRVETKGLTNEEINNKFHDKIERTLRRLLPSSSKSTFHRFTRGVYGAISYEEFADKSKQSFTSWLSLVLGHQRGSLTSALSYQSVYLRKPLGYGEALRAREPLGDPGEQVPPPPVKRRKKIPAVV